jgi:2'-5' RNA ligase
MRDDDSIDDGESWRRSAGIFVIVEVKGTAGERIHEIQRRFDPKLAATNPPHITLVGSSGVGPISAGTSEDEIRRRLGPVAQRSAPLTLAFGPPHRFMQTNIVVLPLDPHGPLRTLHERIATSGLSFARARFAFTPHATLNFFRTLSKEEIREILSLRVPEPVIVDHLRFSLTDDPNPAQNLFELRLGDAPERA